MTLQPILGPDLLPMTFRNLLTNDVVNQLGFPLTQILNEEPGLEGASRLLTEDVRRYLRVVTRLYDYITDPNPVLAAKRKEQFVEYLNSGRGEKDRKAVQKHATDEIRLWLTALGVSCGLDLQDEGKPCPDGKVQASARQSERLNQYKTRPVSPAQIRASIRTLSPRVALPSLSFSNGL